MITSIHGRAFAPPLADTVGTLRQRAESLSREVSTGRVDDLSSHLNGKTGLAMLSRKAVDQLSIERGQLRLELVRTDLGQRALEAVDAASQGLSERYTIAAGFNDVSELRDVAKQSRAALEQVFSALTARQDQRYLFSGTRSDRPPLEDVGVMLGQLSQQLSGATTPQQASSVFATYFDPINGNFANLIYQGTATAPDSASVTVLDPAIVDVVAGLAALAFSDQQGVPAAAGNAFLETGAARLATGRTDLVDVRASIGTAQARADSRLEALDREETFLTRSFNDLTAKDPYVAATELRSVETNLEAAYLLTTRLANLSLLNYMR